ncbi:PH domain-containing protein [Quadrisphaera sp. DSM 44207]|uniref:PH domain-containing protein n=1 Tax=Quadrisphaera sp. DSM 44207 TaxID=1881057 RepID=UPI00087E06D1|nr:PH domain-containing protein [Quadrisphaera sp. DSM 44207]SDQ45726.1 PH domain-containing protein [Quadrisphaera sp. DSM 44207]
MAARDRPARDRPARDRSAGPPDALHAPFRPRRGPAVARVTGVAAVAMGVVLALLLPGAGVLDQLGFVAVGAAIAGFLHLQASVRAVPSAQGLFVRNLVQRRQLEWAEVVDVHFGGGRPWVQLDLADGDTLAVMGVQRADGPFADREARRLATLVALHTRTERDD